MQTFRQKNKGCPKINSIEHNPLPSSPQIGEKLSLKAMHSPWKQWHMHGECRDVCICIIFMYICMCVSEYKKKETKVCNLGSEQQTI